MNEIHVTLRGNVASEPRHVTFDDGGTITSFRLASNARRFDRERQEWVDRETTYVNVNCRKAMALNAAASVRKGHPVVVTGRLRERFWSSNGRTGQSLEVDAETLGHDLSFGTTEFVRIVRAERVQTAKDREASEMAYLLAKDAAEDGPVIEVSGLTVLDDHDGPEPGFGRPEPGYPPDAGYVPEAGFAPDAGFSPVTAHGPDTTYPADSGYGPGSGASLDEFVA